MAAEKEAMNKIHPAVRQKTAGLVPVIIEYEQSVAPEKKALRELGCKPGRVLKALHGISAECPADTLETLAGDDDTVYVWEDEMLEPLLDVTVPFINATAAWADFGNGTGINVSILDTGINTSHAALAGQVILEENFITEYSGEDLDDYCNHGTPVACTVGCVDSTYRGVAPGVKLFNAKTGFRTDPYRCGSPSSAIIAAIDWSIEHGAQIIQISAGAPVVHCYDSALAVAVNNTGKNITIVVAAGNSGPGNESIATPACAENALAVGASNGDAIADFSSRGPTDYGLAKPDLVAPGVSITAADGGGNGFSDHTGTSFSAPHVSGVAALMLEQNHFLFPWLVKEVLKNTSVDLGYDENTQGAGRVDAWAAVNLTTGVVVPPLLIITPAVPSGNAVAKSFVINATVKNIGGENAENATAVLSVPEKLSILDGAERAIGTIGPGSSAFVNWTVNASLSGNYSANITASAAGIEGAVSFFTVSVDVTTFGLELQPDAASGKDAYISSKQQSANKNYGASTIMSVESSNPSQRALVQWNLSGISADAAVVNAVATFYVPSVESGTNATITVYRLIRGWLEGNGTGQATGNGATWNTYDGVNSWTTAGGDYNNTSWASMPVGTANQYYNWNITGLISAWHTGTYANNGMIMVSGGTSRKDMSSSDDSNASRRPLLQINYTL